MKTCSLIGLLLFAGQLLLVEDATAHTVTKAREQIRCPNPKCHKMNPAWAKVCQYCGTRLLKHSSEPRRRRIAGPRPTTPAMAYAEFVDKGNAAIAASNWSVAAASFEKALALKGTGRAALMGSSLSEYELGHKDKAFKLATSAWKVGSQGTWTRYVLGMTTPEDENAIPHLQACASNESDRFSDPAKAELTNRGRPHKTAGNAAVDAKNWDLGKKEFTLARQCDPDDSDASAGQALCLHEVAIATNDPAMDKKARQLASKLQEAGSQSPWVSFVMMITSEPSDDQMIALFSYIDANPDGPFTAEAKERLAHFQALRAVKVTIHTNIPAHIVIKDAKGMVVFDQQTDADTHLQKVDLTAGTYTLTATSSGYEKVEKPITVGDKESQIEVSLKPISQAALR